MVLRVAGTDPGTSSLDVIVLTDGEVQAQHRFAPETLRANPAAPVRWLEGQGPFAIIAGPSGYGLPLVRAADCGDRDLALMALVRPGDGRASGVSAFSAVVRNFRDSALPVVFLPGVIHLLTVPPHRKLNRIDLGTADKLCVAALALAIGGVTDAVIVELGSVFTACLAVKGGVVVSGLGGTSGPLGWASQGAWDGELAYLLSPLEKGDLFGGGAGQVPEAWGGEALVESVCQAVAGMAAPLGIDTVVLAGRLGEVQGAVVSRVVQRLRGCGLAAVDSLGSLPGAWVKHAAQGAAVIADGLAGGKWQAVIERMRVREAGGTALDWLRHPRADAVRAHFA